MNELLYVHIKQHNIFLQPQKVINFGAFKLPVAVEADYFMQRIIWEENSSEKIVIFMHHKLNLELGSYFLCQ